MPRSLLRLRLGALSLTLTAALLASSTDVLAVTTTTTTQKPVAPLAIRVALPRTQMPNWFLPFQGADTATLGNVAYFQQLLYRPLYWIDASKPNGVDLTRSVAAAVPAWNTGSSEATITLAPARWSNGAAVSASDVVFWLNLLTAAPSTWHGYVPALANGTAAGIPDLLAAVSAPNATTVVVTLKRPVDRGWFLKTQLSQITPLPQAFDKVPSTWFADGSMGAHDLFHHRTAANWASSGVGRHPSDVKTAGCWSSTWIGSGNTGPASTTTFGRDVNGAPTVVTNANAATAEYCVDVRATLRSLALDTDHYQSAGTLTQSVVNVTDGPWVLTTFHSSRDVLTLSDARDNRTLTYVGCASDADCFNLLRTKNVNVGEIATTYLKPTTSLLPAKLATLQPTTLKTLGYGFAPHGTQQLWPIYLNQLSTDGVNQHAGSVLAQPYARQALSRLVNQPGLVSALYGGYGNVASAPLATTPPNTVTASTLLKPYSPASALALFVANGWTRTVSGLTCTKPTLCGPGVALGAPLSLSLWFSLGSRVVPIAAALRAAFASVGVTLNAHPVSPSNFANTVSSASTNWGLAIAPTPLNLLQSSVASLEGSYLTASYGNVGGYVSAASLDPVIASYWSTGSALSFANALVTSLPVLSLPTPLTLSEVQGLQNVSFNPNGNFTPEGWTK